MQHFVRNSILSELVALKILQEQLKWFQRNLKIYELKPNQRLHRCDTIFRGRGEGGAGGLSLPPPHFLLRCCFWLDQRLSNLHHSYIYQDPQSPPSPHFQTFSAAPDLFHARLLPRNHWKPLVISKVSLRLKTWFKGRW